MGAWRVVSFLGGRQPGMRKAAGVLGGNTEHGIGELGWPGTGLARGAWGALAVKMVRTGCGPSGLSSNLVGSVVLRGPLASLGPWSAEYHGPYGRGCRISCRRITQCIFERGQEFFLLFFVKGPTDGVTRSS